jgi:hypothetical protein
VYNRRNSVPVKEKRSITTLIPGQNTAPQTYRLRIIGLQVRDLPDPCLYIRDLRGYFQMSGILLVLFLCYYRVTEWTKAHRKKYERFLLDTLSFPNFVPAAEQNKQDSAQELARRSVTLSMLPHRSGG